MSNIFKNKKHIILLKSNFESVVNSQLSRIHDVERNEQKNLLPPLVVVVVVYTLQSSSSRTEFEFSGPATAPGPEVTTLFRGEILGDGKISFFPSV